MKIACTLPWIFTLLITACMNTTADQYEYADGSANLYRITRDSVQYIPVTPAESSTGFYSGGKPATVSITAEQFQLLKQQLDGAIADTSLHTPDRAKRTALIVRTGPQDTTRVILHQGAAPIAIIETYLKELLQR